MKSVEYKIAASTTLLSFTLSIFSIDSLSSKTMYSLNVNSM